MSADIDFGDDDSNNITSDWSTHMVRGTWLSKNQGIFHYGLPSPLLECFRKAQCPGLHTNRKVNFFYFFKKSCFAYFLVVTSVGKFP